MPDLAVALLALAAGATGGHLLYGRRYKTALRHIIAAANDPHNRHLGRALDHAEHLLRRHR